MDDPPKGPGIRPAIDMRQLEALSKAMRPAGLDESTRRLAKIMADQSAAMRAALGPFEDLRRSGRLDVLLGASDALARAMQGLKYDYRLPEMNEAMRAFDEFRHSVAGARFEAMALQAAEIGRAMEGLHAPWLKVADTLRSVGGMAELQGIGLALRQMPSFDPRVVESLRISLGDWSKPIVWPQDIFNDVMERSRFYEAQGLDLRLTEFPAAAFEEGAQVAGLIVNPPWVEMYSDEAIERDADGDEEEEGFARTNDAHDRLLRFETQIRRFIEERMREAFGSNWIRQRVPDAIWRDWIEKQNTARDRGEQERPLIAFADFTHYVPIITRNDNWTAVFKPVFRRKEFVMESFQRLYPVRNCTMHARLITQDDELYLYVEVKRLLQAIGIGG